MSKIIIGAVVVVLLGLGAWWYLGSAPTEVLPVEIAPEASSTMPISEASSTIKSFTVVGQNYSFAPATMTAQKGDTVTITFKNVDGVHDFKIDEFGVATKRINNGQQEVVTFVADKTGAFEYYCYVGNHRKMGMKGVLTVTE